MSKLVKIIYQPTFLVILSLVSLALSWSLMRTASKTKQASQNLAQTQERVSIVKKEVAELETSLQSAQAALSQEKIIRNELLMKKPGEYVVQIADEELAQLQAKQVEQAQETEVMPWVEWKKLLF